MNFRLKNKQKRVKRIEKFEKFENFKRVKKFIAKENKLKSGLTRERERERGILPTLRCAWLEFACAWLAMRCSGVAFVVLYI